MTESRSSTDTLTGLSEAEVAIRWKQHGFNELPSSKSRSIFATARVPLYGGPTDTKSVKAALESGENLGISSLSDEKVKSIRNVSRGDRI